jgi:osmotically inducible lipoprotein OsmB
MMVFSHYQQQDNSVKIRKLAVSALVISMAIGLAGCGYSPGSRALSGGAIGAGAGSIIGAVTGLGPAGGALIGGAAGAIGGAVTNPHTVNLGRPL